MGRGFIFGLTWAGLGEPNKKHCGNACVATGIWPVVFFFFGGCWFLRDFYVQVGDGERSKDRGIEIERFSLSFFFLK